MRVLLIAAGLCSMLPANSWAENISEFVDRAGFAGVVQIYSASEHLKSEVGEGCGIEYAATVVDSFAGNQGDDRVTFRARIPLRISQRYLIFLTDEIDPDAEPTTAYGGIVSTSCAESGAKLTAMKVGDGELRAFGPDAILESRYQPGARREHYAKTPDYFFGDQAIVAMIKELDSNLLQGLAPIDIEVERARWVERGMAVQAEPLLKILRELD